MWIKCLGDKCDPAFWGIDMMCVCVQAWSSRCPSDLSNDRKIHTIEQQMQYCVIPLTLQLPNEFSVHQPRMKMHWFERVLPRVVLHSLLQHFLCATTIDSFHESTDYDWQFVSSSTVFNWILIHGNTTRGLFPSFISAAPGA